MGSVPPVPPEFEQLATTTAQSVVVSMHSEAAAMAQQNATLIRSAVQELTAEMERHEKVIVAKLETKDSRPWQVGLALLPIIATSFLGWLIFHLQIETNAKIDRAGKELSTRLALSQQFYLQRFTIYDDADKRMVQLLAAVRNLDRSPNDADRKKQAATFLTQLNVSARTNSFYMTPDVSASLAAVWLVATQLPQLNNSGTKKIEDLDAAIKKVEEQMRQELLVNIEPVDDVHQP